MTVSVEVVHLIDDLPCSGLPTLGKSLRGCIMDIVSHTDLSFTYDMDKVTTVEELCDSLRMNGVTPQPELVRVGSLWLGRYSLDDVFYRAVVTSVDIANECAEVRFIDYGNHDTVPFKDLRYLTQTLLDFPPLSIKAFWDCDDLPANPTDELRKLENIDIDCSIASFKVCAFANSSKFNYKCGLEIDIKQPLSPLIQAPYDVVDNNTHVSQSIAKDDVVATGVVGDVISGKETSGFQTGDPFMAIIERSGLKVPAMNLTENGATTVPAPQSNFIDAVMSLTKTENVEILNEFGKCEQEKSEVMTEDRSGPMKKALIDTMAAGNEVGKSSNIEIRITPPPMEIVPTAPAPVVIENESRSKAVRSPLMIMFEQREAAAKNALSPPIISAPTNSDENSAPIASNISNENSAPAEKAFTHPPNFESVPSVTPAPKTNLETEESATAPMNNFCAEDLASGPKIHFGTQDLANGLMTSFGSQDSATGPKADFGTQESASGLNTSLADNEIYCNIVSIRALTPLLEEGELDESSRSLEESEYSSATETLHEQEELGMSLKSTQTPSAQDGETRMIEFWERSMVKYEIEQMKAKIEALSIDNILLRQLFDANAKVTTSLVNNLHGGSNVMSSSDTSTPEESAVAELKAKNLGLEKYASSLKFMVSQRDEIIDRMLKSQYQLTK